MRLFEVIQLNEYNQSATLNKWGKRIGQAAVFSKQHLKDNWFNLVVGDTEEKLAPAVLRELENIDPTPNKQYVMTLVRWYIGVVKVHDQNQKLYTKLRKAELEGGAADDWEEGYNKIWPETYTDLGKGDDNQSASYVTDRATEDWNIDDAEFDLDKIGTQSTFKLEDAEQIHEVFRSFERIKPQLQPNERDIGRFKNFYRFEDFVDEAMDSNYAAPETGNQALKRSDVDVIYNGPLGTVTIPRSHEASCELGSGTKWCTTGKDDYWYDSYSKQGDLIIYNEKPGNAKYQIHVTVDGIEARDSRDRIISYEKRSEFVNKHPVLSKLIAVKKDEVITKIAQQPFSFPMNLESPFDMVKKLITFNQEHQAGVMRYVDGYFIQFALPELTNNTKTPRKEWMDFFLAYVSQRKQWPEVQPLVIKLLVSLMDKFDPRSNNTINTMNRLITDFEKINSNWPELEQFKTQLLAIIQQANTD